MFRYAIELCLLFIFLFSISACDDKYNRTDDLKMFVAEIKARPSGRIEPLPSIKLVEKFPLILIDQNLFIEHTRRKDENAKSLSCYSPIERKIPHLLKEKSINELVFTKYLKSRWTFNVTIWDGNNMAVYQKDSLISQEPWQILRVDDVQVTLGKLDQCSQVIETKLIAFTDK